jgi:hypothetical protein
MSYAYFQGQELQALDYYERLCKLTSDPKSKGELEALVQKLKEAVAEKEAVASTDGMMLYNASSGGSF